MVTALDSGQRLTRLLTDILDLSRVESGKLVLVSAPFSLHDVFASIRSVFATSLEQRELTLEIAISPDVPAMLVGDEGRIRQVLLNLVGNAIKFTKTGGVFLEAGSSTDRETGKERLVLGVSDTGIGIPHDKIKMIFDAFTQVDASNTRIHQGAGLGLSIVDRLVGLMGGTVWIDSEPGIGTCIMCTLLLPQAPASQEPPAAPAIAATNRLRILLVEDERINRLAVGSMLRKQGHDVVETASGQDALEQFGRESFDAVLLDIQMPAMDGLETLAIMRDTHIYGPKAVTPAIALTAHAMAGDRERFLAAGMDDYLAKPVEAAALAAMLARVCEGRQKRQRREE